MCSSSSDETLKMLRSFEKLGVNENELYICISMSPPYLLVFVVDNGPDSSVGIAADYGLDGLGSNPGGDGIFRPSSPALGPTQPPVHWVLGLSRGCSAAGACC